MYIKFDKNNYEIYDLFYSVKGIGFKNKLEDSLITKLKVTFSGE